MRKLDEQVKYINYNNDNCNLTEFVNEYLKENYIHNENNVYFVNLNEIERLYKQWKSRFPEIHPYYAIKCNPDKEIIKVLANLGANFDCASIAEIEHVLSIGISPDRILFANPCKMIKDMVAAYNKGVKTVTFDNVTELLKVVKLFPDMKLILRIFAKDPKAKCQFSHKFGAEKHIWKNIFETGKNINANICGVSFHVGSYAVSPDKYDLAIKDARECYDLALSYGFKFNLIDIGGGFVSHNLGDIPEAIIEAKNKYFPDELQCKFIAEPGRYFAETSSYLATNIIGIREHDDNTLDYWITDSIYGSFNCIFYDHNIPYPEYIDNGNSKCKITLYGPTCDGLDKIIELDSYPKMNLHDWIIFKNMGAYTRAGSCNFNGIAFCNPDIIYLL